MILTQFGLDLGHPYRCVNINEDVFEEFFSLESLSNKTDTVNIALPDKFIFQEKIDKNKLRSIVEKLSFHQISVAAVETESQAIARALRYFDNHSANHCFAILTINFFNPDAHQLWISVFHGQKKIFFHEEKILIDMDQMINNYKRFLNRALKLLKITNAELKITQYYFMTSKTHLSSWLIACGLSLWNKKSDHNYLLKITNQFHIPTSWREKKMMVKQLLKTFFYGFITLSILYLGMFSFLQIENNKLSLLQKKITIIQSQSQPLFTMKSHIKLLHQQIDDLFSFKQHQQLPINLLDALSHIMPEGVFLNSLTFEQNKFSLLGRAQVENQILALHKNLLSQKYFQHAVIKNTTQDESAPPYHYSFAIESEHGEEQ